MNKNVKSIRLDPQDGVVEIALKVYISGLKYQQGKGPKEAFNVKDPSLMNGRGISVNDAKMIEFMLGMIQDGELWGDVFGRDDNPLTLEESELILNDPGIKNLFVSLAR
jgi:hypothetical protein